MHLKPKALKGRVFFKDKMLFSQYSINYDGVPVRTHAKVGRTESMSMHFGILNENLTFVFVY